MTQTYAEFRIPYTEPKAMCICYTEPEAVYIPYTKPKAICIRYMEPEAMYSLNRT